jgi:uncharacterized ParB-like nuclease family protein
MDPLFVQELAGRMLGGEKLPPVVVYFDGEDYWLFDGFHRVYAAQSIRRRKIIAEIMLGTYADMQAEWELFLETLRRDLRTCP